MPRRPVTSPTQPTSCEACEAPIFFAVAPSGSLMPVDASPRADGSAAVTCDHAGTWRARILGPGDSPGPAEKKHMPHWVTCPHADKFRRRARSPQRARPVREPGQPAQPALFPDG